MNEDDYRRELAQKDSTIADLASQLAQTNNRLAELMRQKQQEGNDPPPSPPQSDEPEPAEAMNASVAQQFKAILAMQGINPDSLPPGAIAFIRASAIAQKR